jgi:cytochrome P450
LIIPGPDFLKMADLSTLALYSAVVLAVGYYLYRAALPRPLPGIPYNKTSANSILGDAPAAIATQKATGDMRGWFTDQLIKHNAPIVQIFMRPLGRPFVLISDFRETQDIMTRRTREFDRSNFFGDMFVSLLPDNMVHMATTDTWKMHRKLMADTMSPAFLSSAAGPQMHNNALKLIALWREKARLAGGHPFDASEDVKAAAMDIIWAATFGTDMGVADSQTKLVSGLGHLELPSDPEAEAIFPRAPNPRAFESILAYCESVRSSNVVCFNLASEKAPDIILADMSLDSARSLSGRYFPDFLINLRSSSTPNFVMQPLIKMN